LKMLRGRVALIAVLVAIAAALIFALQRFL
jgi:hypothetical protein